MMFISRQLFTLDHVLLGRILFVEHIMLCFLRSFSHEIVLSQDFFGVLKLTHLNVAVSTLESLVPLYVCVS